MRCIPCCLYLIQKGIECIKVGAVRQSGAPLSPALNMHMWLNDNAGSDKELAFQQWGTASCDAGSHLATSDDDRSVSEVYLTISPIIYPCSNAIVVPGPCASHGVSGFLALEAGPSPKHRAAMICAKSADFQETERPDSTVTLIYTHRQRRHVCSGRLKVQALDLAHIRTARTLNDGDFQASRILQGGVPSGRAAVSPKGRLFHPHILLLKLLHELCQSSSQHPYSPSVSFFNVTDVLATTARSLVSTSIPLPRSLGL